MQLTRKEAEKLLEDHYISLYISECDLCGPHEDVECSCGYESRQGGVSGITDHILEVLFKEEDETPTN